MPLPTYFLQNNEVVSAVITPLSCPRTVLLIDDDEANAVLLRRRLGKVFPQASVMVSTSKMAPSVCRSRAADLIVLAYSLGGKTAPELLPSIRSENVSHPILVVCGTQTYRDQCLAAGATFYATYDDNFAHVIGSRPTPNGDRPASWMESCRGAA